jgi:hypothetical protein
MRIAMTATLLLTTLATGSLAADVTIPVKLKANEWIGASLIEDDGSGTIIVTSPAPRASRVIRFDARGKATEVGVAGVSINSIQPLGGNRYFIRGGVGSGKDAHYAARIVDLATGATSWDSSKLVASTNENAVTAVDAKGEHWAALVPTSLTRFSVLFGGVSANGATMKYHFENEATFGAGPSAQFTGGSWDLAVLGGRAGDTHVAVLTPQGSVYIVSAESGTKAILSPERGGGQLLWEQSTRTLWVESGESWSAFPLADTLDRQKAKTAAPASGRATVTTSFDRKHGSASSAFPLTGGRFALRTRSNGESAVEIFSAHDAAPQVVPLPGIPEEAIVKVSSGGRAILTLPNGPRSAAAVVKLP